MQDDVFNLLPWSWQQKVADFQKPNDVVFPAPQGAKLSQALEQVEPESLSLVLSPTAACDEEDIHAVHRALKKDGFFLTQQFGSDDCRRLAEFVNPEYAPQKPHNLETQLPLFRPAGFRVMFRDQAYPVLHCTTVSQALQILTAAPHLSQGFTEQQLQAARPTLEHYLATHATLPVERHLFLVIGKKM